MSTHPEQAPQVKTAASLLDTRNRHGEIEDRKAPQARTESYTQGTCTKHDVKEDRQPCTVKITKEKLLRFCPHFDSSDRSHIADASENTHYSSEADKSGSGCENITIKWMVWIPSKIDQHTS